MIANGVDIANVWTLTGCGPYGLFNVDGTGAVLRTPPFYAFKALAHHLRGTLIGATTDDPRVRVFAALNGAEAALVLVNIAPDAEAHCAVQGLGDTWLPAGGVRVERTQLEGELIPGADGTVVVPAYGIAVARYRNTAP